MTTATIFFKPALPRLGFSSAIIILLVLSSSFLSAGHSSLLRSRYTLSPVTDALSHLDGNGVPASMSWTGDGQRINNPSFETGSLQPWFQTELNAAQGSTAVVTTPGYSGSHSAQLTVLSGNFTSPSYISIVEDLTNQNVGFSPSERFRAAVFPQQLAGTSVYDRIEISIRLSSNIGGVVEIHYVFADASMLTSNSTMDAYYLEGASMGIGRWASIDRDVYVDASVAFPGVIANLDSVSQVTLTVYSQTQPGAPNHHPRLKFWDSDRNLFWDQGEPVVLDADGNSTGGDPDGGYNPSDTIVGGCLDSSSNPIVCTSPIPSGQSLSSSRYIKFVDTNGSGVWHPGESIIYDCNSNVCDNNVYDYYDPVVIGPIPPVDTLLMKTIQERTSALFDMVELYSASGGSEWVKNGSFETGALTGWGQVDIQVGRFLASSVTSLPPGGYSVEGSVTAGMSGLAQSIDGKPLVDNGMRFIAAANVTTMSGASSTDTVDVWLGMVDANYNSVSVYYVFKTGDGNMPTNRTDTIYRRVPGFGGSNQWLSINASLNQETTAFNLLGYNPPYTVEIVGFEVSAQSSSTTTAYLDNFSLHTRSYVGAAASSYHAVDGQNTTYVYTASKIPQGSLEVEMPSGVTVRDVIVPDGTVLQPSEYTTRLSPSCTLSPCTPNPRIVIIPDTTFFNHAPIGDWRIVATSTNTISKLYAEDPASRNPVQNVIAGSTLNFVSQANDPFGQSMPGVQANMTLWNTNDGVEVGAWPGPTNMIGWWNVSRITLPLVGTRAGTYTLRVSIIFLYVGIRTFQISARYAVAISCNISLVQVTAGASVTISGIVTQTTTSPAGPVPGINVRISYRPTGSSQWIVLGETTADNSGQYSFSWTPNQGDYQVKASTSDSQTSPTESAQVQLTVQPPGFVQQYWLLLLLTSSALAAVVASAIILRLRKSMAQESKGQTQTVHST